MPPGQHVKFPPFHIKVKMDQSENLKWKIYSLVMNGLFYTMIQNKSVFK